MTGTKRSIPLHVLFFAAYPILYLYQQNRDEVTPSQVAVPLALSVAAALVITAAAWAILRSAYKGALIGTLAVTQFFSYGHIKGILNDVRLFGETLGRDRYLVPLWALIAIGGVVLVARAKDRQMPNATRIFNYVGAGLALTALVSVALVRAPATASADPTPEPLALAKPAKPRDIYYLVFDRYPGPKTLSREFGYDNESFLRWLEDRGFSIARDGRANYVNTMLSLSSSMNLDLLDHLATGNQRHWSPARRQLQYHRVGVSLRSIGYRYYHIGSWSEMTRVSPIADLSLKPDNLTEFERVLLRTTFLGPMMRTNGESRFSRRQEHFQIGRAQFRRLNETIAMPGPKFVFAHVLLPHPPYVFTADGRYIARDEQRLPLRQRFVEQLKYTNARLQAFLERLLDRPDDERPIVVLTADEGPYPERWMAQPNYASRSLAPGSTDAELQMKYGIMAAYLLPGVERPPVPEDMTPVNNWRLLFNLYFGTDLPMLPNDSFAYMDAQNRYTFRPITDRLDDG